MGDDRGSDGKSISHPVADHQTARQSPSRSAVREPPADRQSMERHQTENVKSVVDRGPSNGLALLDLLPTQPAERATQRGQPLPNGLDTPGRARHVTPIGLPTSQPSSQSPSRTKHPSSSRHKPPANPPSHTSPSRRAIISQQPGRHAPMKKKPHRTTRDFTAAHAAMSANSIAHQRAEAAKAPLRAQVRAMDNWSSWKRFRWGCQMKPLWEAEGACCHKTNDEGVRATKYGHADGCCEVLGLRGCFCLLGGRLFGAEGCCEGCGCVRCCGWEHRCWDLWFGGK
ncbi:hypothetical protein IQ07DRAFT_48583 [Pyrenochaeta sp. DS3sAY3a]|nr:hypothetical protein IQ07DRAFT_48583 [Pyrenochaeta sp. DS3sAY3a]